MRIFNTTNQTVPMMPHDQNRYRLTPPWLASPQHRLKFVVRLPCLGATRRCHCPALAVATGAPQVRIPATTLSLGPFLSKAGWDPCSTAARSPLPQQRVPPALVNGAAVTGDTDTVGAGEGGRGVVKRSPPRPGRPPSPARQGRHQDEDAEDHASARPRTDARRLNQKSSWVGRTPPT